MDEVFPIDWNEVEKARDLVLERRDLSARDALHAAVMTTHGVDRILSFDTAVDTLPPLRRIF